MSEKQTPEVQTPASPKADNMRRGSYLPLIVIPLLLFVGIGWFAPNFVNMDGPRDHPLGGDFMQEYAGGKLFLESQANRRTSNTETSELYNVNVCREIQHDHQMLGFEWDKSNYFPMVYPPFYYAAVSPFSKLKYHTAARLWLFLMTLGLIGGLCLLRRCGFPNRLLLALCLAPPLLLSLTTGQKSSMLFLILTGTWFLLSRKKQFSAGAVFGLIAFKPHLGIPIGLFMLCRKQWSFVFGCYFTVGLLILASLATGFDTCCDFFAVTMGFNDYVHNGGYHLEQGFSLWSAFQLAIQDASTVRYVTVISSLLILLGSAFLLRKPQEWNQQSLNKAFSIMTIATVLVAPHLYSYDLTMLLLPIALLGHAVVNGSRQFSDIAPLVALILVVAGSGPLTSFAAVSNLQLGVPLMVFAWAIALNSLRSDRVVTLNSPAVLPKMQQA